MDHCFSGSLNNRESAHANPFLVLHDYETEAMFAIAVASKSTKEWIVEFVKQMLYELDYNDLKVAIIEAKVKFIIDFI